MKNHFGIAAVITAGLLTGCASTGYDASHPWEDGWRKGTIVEMGEGVAYADKVSEKCRQDVASTSSKTRYATIKYRRDRRNAWRTMPVSEDFALKVGDPVFINAGDCKAPVNLRHQDGR
ncbi:MAG: hypothetical protein IT368_02190 [Candidatus Hydrogenedentes bacterium]|nr:hypothetical protein [Burkholderiales bacterium]MCC6142593.1 hypothetical protein [Candidatus Hydrogenedentota bacterium]